jgi:hypothetical protein
MADTIFTYNGRIPTLGGGGRIPYFIKETCPANLLSDMSNLQLYYKLDGNALDSSGNGDNGTATGMTYTTGKFGDAGIFATGSYVSTPQKGYSVSTEFTVSAWVKTSTITSTFPQMIISSDRVNMSPATNDRRVWQFRVDTTTGYLRFVRFSNNTTVVSNFAGNTNIADGNWHHVAAVFNNTSGSIIYLDGVNHASDSVTTNNNSPTDMQPVVGGSQTGTSGVVDSYFIGNIDEAILFNRALTLSEIQSLAAGTCPLKS